MKISVEEALHLLLDGREVMVKPYDDDYENFTGVTLEHLIENLLFDSKQRIFLLSTKEAKEVWEYLEEKLELEFWD